MTWLTTTCRGWAIIGGGCAVIGELTGNATASAAGAVIMVAAVGTAGWYIARGEAATRQVAGLAVVLAIVCAIVKVI